jgi:hypothetical protein
MRRPPPALKSATLKKSSFSLYSSFKSEYNKKPLLQTSLNNVQFGDQPEFDSGAI